MPSSPPKPVTMFGHGAERLESLCDAIGFEGQERATARGLFSMLLHPWGDLPVKDEPTWPSDITDDHTPYEFSLAVERHRPELRLLAEAQPTVPNVWSQWEAGLALCDRLESEAGAFFGRFRAIHDLFAPEDETARFGIWHAVNVRAGTAPKFKIYLNPQAKGKEHASEVISEALSRLGFGDAARNVPRSPKRIDEIKYFSLDLDESDVARVKVYLVHHRATTADIETALSAATNYVAGESSEFCRSMAGHSGPYVGLPLQTCYSFTTRGGERPVAGTLYFPVRSYADSDDMARRRIIDYMIADDRPLYERVIASFARRHLDAGTGMQTYASYRRQNFCRRVTVYLSPEAYAIGPRSMTSPVSGVRTTQEMGLTHTSAPWPHQAPSRRAR